MRFRAATDKPRGPGASAVDAGAAATRRKQERRDHMDAYWRIAG